MQKIEEDIHQPPGFVLGFYPGILECINSFFASEPLNVITPEMYSKMIISKGKVVVHAQPQPR